MKSSGIDCSTKRSGRDSIAVGYVVPYRRRYENHPAVLRKNAIDGSASDCGADGIQHLLVARKSQHTFLRDKLIADPDCELSSTTASRFNFDSEFFFEQCRHPGSPWRIGCSNQTVTNHNPFHGFSIVPPGCFAASRSSLGVVFVCRSSS